MDIEQMIQKLLDKATQIEQVHQKLNGQLLSIESGLDKSLAQEQELNKRLEGLLKAGPRIAAVPVAAPAVEAVPEPVMEEPVEKINQVPVVDPLVQLEKLLQGSLDVLGDKISNRLMNMLKEL